MAVSPTVAQTQDIAVVQAGKGVTFQELTGRQGIGSSHTSQSSVALFRLAAGAASSWSHNKVGEESFLILSGRGTVWIGNLSQAVRPGSFIVIPPNKIRSVRASEGEALSFYALTTPAWNADDDVHVEPPAGAPR